MTPVRDAVAHLVLFDESDVDSRDRKVCSIVSLISLKHGITTKLYCVLGPTHVPLQLNQEPRHVNCG
jgi:hypothetical protein